MTSYLQELHSQYYNITGKHRELLIDNLFELYIKRTILWSGKTSFYSRIYRASDDEEELTLLEEVMKAVLLDVLKKYKVPFSYDDRTRNLNIYNDDLYDLEDWCNKRESLVKSGD